ncbi:MAG: hypothetical protein AMXMBFR13_22480 [Phycisphaerae bacterium]
MKKTTTKRPTAKATKRTSDPLATLTPMGKTIWRSATGRGKWPPERQALLLVAIDAMDRYTTILHAVNQYGATARTTAGTIPTALLDAETTLRGQVLDAWSLLFPADTVAAC